MPLFQQTVIKKHIANFDAKYIEDRWQKFQTIFHNSVKQQNIRNSNEIQYQSGFLRDLFEAVLGYVMNPEPNYNLLAEKKNNNDSRKADGAILINGKVIAVIELKGTKTIDLKSIEDQAFNYKNSHPTGCSYIITSNFEKLRFYIDNKTQFEEFNLFTLTKSEFEILYACLAWESISKNTPMQLLNESVSNEKKITNSLYKDYSEFKRALFNNMVELNKQFDKLELFKKTQKLLDRFLFIFFAEDRGLVPTNLIFRINKEWENLISSRIQVSLYDRYKMYFNDLNFGNTVTLPAFGTKTGQSITSEFVIFAYNGGLFAPNEILDHICIDDKLLHHYTEKISHYNFESDVDVNILGHIFENSLNEIDEIKSQIQGNLLHKTQTRRKKDGVFYTPRYITKYIVDSTLGKLCNDKKNELGLDETQIDDSFFNKKKDLNEKGKKFNAKIDEYRKWMLNLKICDPACGSGAFLNQALEFLIQEHSLLDSFVLKIQTLKVGGLSQLSTSSRDISDEILENNIYGVDINEESIEIAKLSLWLRTAQSGRKLSSLNNNIKCGNSLIDDPAVAGEKAFSWEKEFPEVFEKGGFDVVIGNPPYGAKVSKEDLNYFVEKYNYGGLNKVFSDTYVSFYILGLSNLLKQKGLLGYIAPNTWRLVSNGSGFRKYITSNTFSIKKIIQHTEKVFFDATVDVDTLIIENNINNERQINIIVGDLNTKFIEHFINQSTLNKEEYINLYLTDEFYGLKSKIEHNSDLVKKLFDIKNGVKPYEVGKGKPAQTKEVLNLKPYTSETKIDETFSPLIGGISFNKYQLLWNNDYWIKYGEWLAAPRSKDIFEARGKLIFRQTSDRIIGMHITDGFVMRNNTHILLNKNDIEIDLKFALAILNSKIINFYYQLINPEKGEALAEVKAFHLENLPIKNISIAAQKPFIEKADLMLSLYKDLQEQCKKFISLLQSDFKLVKPSKKIEEFYSLKWSEFEKELNKNKITLLGIQKDDWFDRFDRFKKQALELKSQIDQTDKEIDKMVYELYGLTEEEIAIVEKS
jgi:type I restriction-modification system DNA methylase subunit